MTLKLLPLSSGFGSLYPSRVFHLLCFLVQKGDLEGVPYVGTVVELKSGHFGPFLKTRCLDITLFKREHNLVI